MEREREPERVETDPRTWKRPSEERSEMEARAHEAESIEQPASALKSSAGGRTSTAMDTVSTELVDAKIAASEARTDTKFAELRAALDRQTVGSDGKFALVMQAINDTNALVRQQRSEASSNRNFLAGTMIASALALAGLIAAMLSYGASTFYNGTVIRDMLNRPAVSQAK